ncbi:MAG: hypothetical protein WAP35_07905, partial [Solirubrobacterales bacterium]
TDQTGAPRAGRAVTLHKMPAGTQSGGNVVTTTTGCKLWTGLARGDYEIRIPTGTDPATAERDIYMTSNPVVVPIRVTARAAITRTIDIAAPVTVDPTFATKVVTAGADVTVASAANRFIGPWLAASTKITRASGTEFFVTGTDGVSQMPHATSAIANKMYPDQGGYTTWAGPCDLNKPAATSLVTIPSPANNLTWSPLSTYAPAPVLRVPSLRSQITSTGVANTGRVQVRLRNRIGGGALSAACGAQAALYNQWVRLPGETNTSGWLPDASYALPFGRYDICVRQTGNMATGWGSSSASYTKYMLLSDVDNDWPGPTTRTFDVRSSGSTSSALCGSSSAIGTGSDTGWS